MKEFLQVFTVVSGTRMTSHLGFPLVALVLALKVALPGKSLCFRQIGPIGPPPWQIGRTYMFLLFTHQTLIKHLLPPNYLGLEKTTGVQ